MWRVVVLVLLLSASSLASQEDLEPERLATSVPAPGVTEEGIDEVEGEYHFVPCKPLSRFNLLTKTHDTWCVPLPGWDTLQSVYKDEGLDDYKPGGFHPVAVGDVIDGKYTVKARVARGTFATVWSVESKIPVDLELAPTGIVVKIMKANDGATRMANDELDMYKQLQLNPAHPHITTLLDNFVISGPFGEHHAMVLPRMGVDMEHSRWTGPAEAKLVARDLVRALKYVHRRAIIHADVK